MSRIDVVETEVFKFDELSEEAIIETINCNDYEFTKEGKLY